MAIIERKSQNVRYVFLSSTLNDTEKGFNMIKSDFYGKNIKGKKC